MKLEWLERNTVVTPYLLLAGDEATYREACAQLDDKWPVPWLPKHHGANTHTFRTDTKVTCVVALDVAAAAKREDQVPVIGLLAHEAMHVAQEMFRNIGENEPSPEFQAYAVQNILQQLLWDYVRQKEALSNLEKASGCNVSD